MNRITRLAIAKRFGQVAIFLLALPASGQEFEIKPVGFTSVSGTSLDGTFAVSGVMTREGGDPMSGGDFAITGGFRSVIAVSPLDAEELIVNGGFEDTGGTFSGDSPGLMSLSADSGVIPGWTTTGAELAWVDNANTFGTATPFGTHSLDLTGYHDSPPYGGVTQTLVTTPGQRYRLSFSLGAYQDRAAYSGPMSVAAVVGSASESFTFTPAGTGNQWETFTMNFTADAASTPLTLTGTGSAGGAYLGLDNVSVVVATAEEDLRITEVERLGNELRVSFTSTAGRTYVIQRRADLSSGTWETMPDTGQPGTGEILQIALPVSLDPPRQFFRLLVLP